MKIRLDQLIFERGLAPSRSRARDFILQGKVQVNGLNQTKPASTFPEDCEIKILVSNYVSRGAQKLEHALKTFQINPQNLIVADIGASTGGFTDYLIHHGAQKVYAIDVGQNQLASSLRQNPKVINLESTDIRHLETLPEKVDLIVIDVSYISLKLILPHLTKFLQAKAPIVALLKPQFEAGPSRLPKDGVIKKPEVLQSILDEFQLWCGENYFQIEQSTPSPITGKSGNKEFLYLLLPTTEK